MPTPSVSIFDESIYTNQDTRFGYLVKKVPFFKIANLKVEVGSYVETEIIRYIEEK